MVAFRMLPPPRRARQFTQSSHDKGAPHFQRLPVRRSAAAAGPVAMRLLTLKTVLVGVERDDESLAAIQAGAALAAAAGGALHVVHVTDDTAVTEETLARSVLHGIDARVHVVAGNAADSIRAVADRLRADVIVLGPHRGGGRTGGRSRLGSTALGVVTNAAAPCLVVAQALGLPLRRVLVPVDLSDTSRGALLVALSWASALRPSGESDSTTLTALYVSATRKSVTAGADRVRALEREVAAVRDSGGSWAGVDVQRDAVFGADTAATIAGYATEHGTDLVVLGTRGLGLDPIGRLGSVAAETSLLLRVPLLLVPPAVWLTHARSS
jgi:nucleotide-binding universal stress UspA family protein